jgi:hypothetical protein
MSRRAASFTQADVARALRAAQQVAPGKFRIEIAPGGVIRIAPAADGAAKARELDDEPPPVALLREPRL